MNFILSKLRVKDKQNHLEIEKLTQDMNELMIHFLIEKSNILRIFQYLSKILHQNEAFRRLNTVSRNITEYIFKERLFLLKSCGQLSELLMLLSWGQKQERMLISDRFGANLISIYQLEYENSHHESMDDKKWENLEETIGNIYGKQEIRRRLYPIHLIRNHFKNLNQDRYPKEIPKLKEMIQACELKGINLTKVFCLITILELDYEEFGQLQDDTDPHEFLALFISLIQTKSFEYLPWYESASRKFIMDHYGNRYIQRMQYISFKMNEIILSKTENQDEIQYQNQIKSLYQKFVNLEQKN